MLTSANNSANMLTALPSQTTLKSSQSFFIIVKKLYKDDKEKCGERKSFLIERSQAW